MNILCHGHLIRVVQQRMHSLHKHWYFCARFIVVFYSDIKILKVLHPLLLFFSVEPALVWGFVIISHGINSVLAAWEVLLHQTDFTKGELSPSASLYEYILWLKR